MVPRYQAADPNGRVLPKIGFSDSQAKDLIAMKPVRFSGRLYSHEFTHSFETDNSEARLERDPKRPGLFDLLIDRIPIVQWFRQKHKEFLLKLGIKVP